MALPILASYKDASPPRPSRRRNRTILFGALLVALVVFVFFAHEPAVSVYHNTDWQKLKPSTIFKGPIPRPADDEYDALKGSSSQAEAVPAPQPSGEPIPWDVPIDHDKPINRLPGWIQDLLRWESPDWAWMHIPFYGGFKDRDYDPNRWEAFPRNYELFESNTVDKSSSQSYIYRPYPDYNSDRWHERWEGDYVPCIGFQGVPYNESDKDVVRVYDRKDRAVGGNPMIGSHEVVGINGDVCYDRHSRLGPFGAINDGDVDYTHVNLGQLQNDCLIRNMNRYKIGLPPGMRPPKYIDWRGLLYDHPSTSQDPSPNEPPGKQFQPRTAVLIRSWEDYTYQENDIHAIRSLVSELTLQSGGEYQVFLFVMLKGWEDVEDSAILDEKLQKIPEELRDMTIFWSEEIGLKLYPKVGEWRVERAQYLGVQWFMANHREFEYVWNWEMDARLIGQHYEFTEGIVNFARKQPRKYLWERNARFYIPEQHGSWEQFFNDTNAQIESSPWTHPIWGEVYHHKNGVIGDRPPTSMDKDNFEWGVDEEADFISLLPIWDPVETTWGWKYTLHGYPDDAWNVPKRAYINTHARYSRRLLHAMHQENSEGRLMMSEMWPTTVALHHGLKAVYAPHPIWTMHKWPGEYADAVFNADGWGAGSFKNLSDPDDMNPWQEFLHCEKGRGRAYNETAARLQLPQTGTGPNGEGAMGRWGQERDSIYNVDREHNFYGWTWYYKNDGAALIYWRWLGWKQTFTALTMGWNGQYDDFPDIGTSKWEKEHGQLCMPSMMLHPVKGVKRSEEELQEQEKVKAELDQQDNSAATT